MSKSKHAKYFIFLFWFILGLIHVFTITLLCDLLFFIVSEKAVKRMCEERKQMLQKIIDNDEQWEKAEEEVTQVIAQHSVIQTKLEEQKKLTFMEEQRTRVSGNICTFFMWSPNCMYLDSYTFFLF